MKYGGLKIKVNDFLKLIAFFPTVLIPISFLLYLIFGLIGVVSGLATLIVVEAVIHISLVSLSNKRAAIAEEMLPDALRLISSNLRAGVIPEKAFIESARSEFGPLSEQIKEAGRAMMLGEPMNTAFNKIPEKIDSRLLRKTVSLISEGITKGGNLAHLLEGLAEDIKSSLMLRKDIAAQVMSYGMFIFLALGIGAPLLYASALFLMETLIGLGQIIPVEAMQHSAINLNLSSVNLTGEFLLNYSLLLMSLSAVFGGLLMGLIMSGKEFEGLKYIPILLLLDFGIFYVIKYVILASFAIF